MKLPNGYGSVMKMSGKRRKPYMVRVTTGWTIDPEKGTKKQTYNVIGYAETKQEGLQMLSDYHQNPFDTKAAKMTFTDVYNAWSEAKYPAISKSNVHGYTVERRILSGTSDTVIEDVAA